MKRIAIALLLATLPAIASAQMVTCTNCTHELSVYMGDGGFVAEAAMGAEMVTWVSRCGGVTTSGQLTPNPDRLVAMLFSSCDAENARLELGPVMDGGWFWITDDMNSAVGPLVNQSTLMNPTTDITSAGDSVTMMAGRGAVYMKEMATGRVGILPNILPEAPTPALRKCGWGQLPGGNVPATAVSNWVTEGANPGTPQFAVIRDRCAVGDGGVVVRGLGPADPFSGARTELMNGATIIRPRVGQVVVDVGAYGNGTGHFATQPHVGGRGHWSDPRVGHWGTGIPVPVDWVQAVILPTGPGTQTVLGPGGSNSGISLAAPDGRGGSTLTIGPSTEHCGTHAAPLYHSVNVRMEPIWASNPSQVLGRIHPRLRGEPLPYHTTRTRLVATYLNLTVACP